MEARVSPTPFLSDCNAILPDGTVDTRQLETATTKRHANDAELIMKPLKELSTQSIKNVYLYIGDDIRFDFLPDEIANLGVSIKMIAGGTVSATSFATIVSGLYYPHHGVDDFDKALPQEVPNLLHCPSHNTAFCNTINHPPFNDNPSTDDILVNTLLTEDSPSDIIKTIDPPFILIERGRGGHSPYGDFDGNGTEYYRDRGAAERHQYAREYATGIARDANWFQSQLEVLESRNLAEETLVIYASDHGELLGELGNIGHMAPMHRRLVEVPCVFINPSLPNKTYNQHIIRHIDLLPTIKEAADATTSNDIALPGNNLLTESAPKTGASYYEYKPPIQSLMGNLSIKYKSVWDAIGGYIFAGSRLSNRGIAAVGSLLRGPKAKFRRKNKTKMIKGFLRGDRQIGAPKFSRKEAKKNITTINEQGELNFSNESLEVQKERLEELGYLE